MSEVVIWTQPSGPLCLWQCFPLRPSLTKTDDFLGKNFQGTPQRNEQPRHAFDCDLRSLKLNLWPHNKMGVGTAFTIIAMFPGLNRLNIVPISVKTFLIYIINRAFVTASHSAQKKTQYYINWLIQGLIYWSCICTSLFLLELTPHLVNKLFIVF